MYKKQPEQVGWHFLVASTSLVPSLSLIAFENHVILMFKGPPDRERGIEDPALLLLPLPPCFSESQADLITRSLVFEFLVCMFPYRTPPGRSWFHRKPLVQSSCRRGP